jgi:hypothetical protein
LNENGTNSHQIKIKNFKIQNIGIEDSQGNRRVDQRQVLKITELYDRPNRPETIEVEPEEEVFSKIKA